MKKTKSILFSSVLFVIATFLIVISARYSITPESVEAQTGPTPPVSTTPKKVKLTGYAWSENIGWISFKDAFPDALTKSVYVQPDGSLVGYAWSENIGWIQFGNLGTTPSPGTYNSSVNSGQAKITERTLTGWARAVAAVSGPNLGGWDGWIALNGARIQSAISTTASPVFTPGCINGTCTNGAGWGSTVVGWVDFSGVALKEEGDFCKGPDGATIPDGSFLMYSKIDTDGTCLNASRTCNNGILEGDASFTDASCDEPKDDCVRGGKTYVHGTTVTFFSKAIAGKNQVCEDFKKELTCDDGKFYSEENGVKVEDTGSTFKILKCIGNPNILEQ